MLLFKYSFRLISSCVARAPEPHTQSYYIYIDSCPSHDAQFPSAYLLLHPFWLVVFAFFIPKYAQDNDEDVYGSKSIVVIVEVFILSIVDFNFSIPPFSHISVTSDIPAIYVKFMLHALGIFRVEMSEPVAAAAAIKVEY